VNGFPRIEPLGDSALLLVLGEGTDPALAARTAGLAAYLRAAALSGVSGVVPAYGSLAVFFDRVAAEPEPLTQRLAQTAKAFEAQGAPPAHDRPIRVIPVRYDGPDLAEVAERTGLVPLDVVRRHTEPVYDVYFLGFVPGFAYLGPVDPALVLPRRPTPRRRVPAGSVAIAGAQTGVYPLETPGGWHLIGHTDLVLFDPERDPPNLLAAGDRVRFSPTDG
jgi:KipI family sensor histidine kinase inhibitor